MINPMKMIVFAKLKKTSPKIRIIRKLISTNVPILSTALVSQVLIIMKYVQLRLL